MPQIAARPRSRCRAPDGCGMRGVRLDRPSRRTPARGRAQPGVTLLELLVVMSIAAVLMVIAAPSIDRTRLNMDAQETTVRSLFLMAQRLAAIRGYDVVVSIDTAGRLVYMHEDPDLDMQVDAGERISAVKLDGALAFGRGTAPILRSGLTSAISFVGREASRPAVVFHRDGGVSEGGTFYLTSNRSGNTAYAKDSRAFDLERASGHLVAYRYSGSAWVRDK